MFSFVCCYLHFLCWHLDFWFLFLKSLLIDGLEWNIFTKKRFLALLLQRSDFSLFYYKEAISRSFTRLVCQKKIQKFLLHFSTIYVKEIPNLQKKFEKKSVRPSFVRPSIRIQPLMIISGSYRRISNVNILNERYEKLYGQIFFFLFLVPPKVVSWLLLHFNLFFLF